MTAQPDTSSTQPSSPRQRAIEAFDQARGQTADAFSEAPLLAIAGGIAAGALIAALLPRTDAEARLVRPTAKRVKDSARAAVDAARQTGGDRLGELGLTREKGEETIRSLLEGVADAAKTSAGAALDAARNRANQG